MKVEKYNPKRNAEGYVDPTAYEALKNMHKAGEIWTFRNKKMLIIKNNGRVCNTLALLDSSEEAGDIEVGNGYYTNPAMVQYVYTDTLDRFVERLSKTEFGLTLKAVGDALGVEVFNESNGQAQNEELVKLKIQHKYLQHMYDDLLQKLIEKAVVNNG